MALVMLPCDLPWWSNVQKKLAQIEETPTLEVLLEVMQKLHELCNVSLDPDDDGKDQGVFDGLRHFVEQQLSEEERAHFLGHTVKLISRHARNLKLYRPPRGLNFSLQQQGDCVELSYRLVASLLANAFFSTFPKRTEKTHPTLQDFNFTYFFKGLVESNVQKAKFRSFLNYFDWLEANPAELDGGTLKVSRKVMTGKQWLTIEDWLECGLPLCDVEIKHEGRLDKASSDTMQTVFASARLGGDVLGPGSSQETLQFFTFPEMLAVLLYVEALEDNESLQIENAHHVARIVEPRGRALFEKIEQPKKTSLCCIDAENYRAIPSQQFEEDDILRELNKCLLAFRQNTTCPVVEPRSGEKQRPNRLDQLENTSSKGRLSPIGERDREGSTPGSPDVCTTIFIRQPTPNSKRSSSDSNKLEKDINKRRSWLSPERPVPLSNSSVASTGGGGALLTAGHRGKFIILGSSGECLPVNRHPLKIPPRRDSYSSCESSNDEFHSARDSFDEDDEDGLRARTYMTQLDTPERRFTFAQQLREALKDNNMPSGSTEDSSYAVGISITGSQTRDQNIRVKRGGSCGFVLDGSTGSTSEEREWFDRCRQRQNGVLERRETNESSRYSFESDLGSELEEVYEKFAKWLEEPISSDKPKKLDARDEAVLRFANSLLKRTLSESFVGIPFTEDGLGGERQSTEGTGTIRTNGTGPNDKISQIAQKRTFNVNLRPVATGNWGCGDTKRGDVQLKMVIQWMAASVAGLPYLIYYTAGSEKLTKLDTICRVLKDRKWTVGELAAATLSHAKDILEDPLYYNNDRSYSSFFDKLIGLEQRAGQ